MSCCWHQNNTSDLNGWICTPSRSENVTRGGNKARPTYDVITMVGGANQSFFDIAVIQQLPLQIICTK